MFSFTSNFSSLERNVRKIQRFQESIHEIAGREIVAQVREYAALSQAPDGSKWESLTEAYAKRKQKKFGNRVANKKATSKFLASVKFRDGVIAPSDDLIPQGQGLEKKRISFQVNTNTRTIIETKLARAFESQA